MMWIRSTLLILAISACASQIGTEQIRPLDKRFYEKWSQGLAELTWFRLSQARYGYLSEGHAVTIFVKEKIHPESYVKLDNPKEEGIEVLKCNFIKKFRTGIYDYSMMLTTMTAISGDHSGELIKTSLTVQDWCGHVFSELRTTDAGYNYTLNSYFEGESISTGLNRTLTEDELYNLIRINPNAIPIGEIQMIPSMFFLRLRHTKIAPYTAQIERLNGNLEASIVIRYPDLQRTVTISYSNKFPHAIQSIDETHQTGFGTKTRLATTTLRKQSSEWLPYWKLHNPDDTTMRPDGLLMYSE